MAKAKQEQVFIGVDNEVIELTGAEKEAFLADRAKTNAQIELHEAEYKAKQDARDSAIKKLGEIAGLTKEELDAIL
jgi:hypothetical protein